MSKPMIVSRLILIAVSLYGIFSICEDFKPMMKSPKHFIIAFIFLSVLSFPSLIDWDSKKQGGCN